MRKYLTQHHPARSGGEDAGKRTGEVRVALDRQRKAAYSRAWNLV